MDITKNVTAAARRSSSPRAARSALLFGLAGMLSTSACLSTPRPSLSAATCACTAIDPLARVAGVTSAHRNDEASEGLDSESGGR